MIILPICRVLGDLRHKQRVYEKRKDVAQFSRSLLLHLSGRGLKTEYLEKKFKILPISRVRMCICVRDATTVRQNQSCPELETSNANLFCFFQFFKGISYSNRFRHSLAAKTLLSLKFPKQIREAN